MATTPGFIEHLLEQLTGIGELRARKAFGEYLVYVDDKFVLTVCDNTIYVKKLDYLADLMQNAETGSPYDGAKEHYILNLDDLDFAKQIVKLIADNTHLPEKKTAK